jgi:hypothetical protein
VLVHNCLPVPVSIELLETQYNGSQPGFQAVQTLHEVESLSKVVNPSHKPITALLLTGHSSNVCDS